MGIALDLALRLWSWGWAHWKGIVIVAALGALSWGLWAALDAYGDRRAAEAVAPWQEAAQKAAAAAGVAQAEADARFENQRKATHDAAHRFAEQQTENTRIAGVNRALSERLRGALAEARAASRRDPVPEAGGDPAEPEPEELRLDAGAVFNALDGFARACAKSRDDLRDQANALIDAWPR